jgi:hypothetical protein
MRLLLADLKPWGQFLLSVTSRPISTLVFLEGSGRNRLGLHEI